MEVFKMNKETIFLVEDDLHIQQLVKYNLETSGYKVIVFGNGEDMLKTCETSLPGIILLDIMLPGADGFEICGRLKKMDKASSIPIIFLTAKSEELERVLGLELGADDYIVKPFSVRELTARVKAVLRRSSKHEPENSDLIKHQNLSIDVNRREVLKDTQVIELSLKEFELLRILLQNKGKVLTRELLLEKVWGYEYVGETRTVDVHIRYLRQKIEDDDSNPIFIETIRGVGYKFNDKV
jgi:two-component system, OmpR family, alkaline phosphatase synthesis response regulator PhoP